MRTGGRIRVWVIVVAVGLVAACSSWAPEEPSIAGWPLGDETPCEIPDAPDPKYDRVAIAAMSARVEESDIAEVHCYGEGVYLRGEERFLLTRSGGVTIVVFTLADGSRRGVGVHCLAGCSTASPPKGPNG